MSNNVRVAKVPVDKVAFHPHNVCRDLGDLRPLAASIKRFGVMQPIIVEDYGDTLRLRAGHRRLAAACIAGLTRIPALVHGEALEDDEWLVQSVQENVMRRGLDEAERRRAIIALRDLGCTREGVADAFGVKKSTIDSWARDPDEPRAKRSPEWRCRITLSSLRRISAAWREEATRRHVSAEEILDALDSLGETPDGATAFPDELTRHRRRRTS